MDSSGKELNGLEIKIFFEANTGILMQFVVVLDVAIAQRAVPLRERAYRRGRSGSGGPAMAPSRWSRKRAFGPMTIAHARTGQGVATA